MDGLPSQPLSASTSERAGAIPVHGMCSTRTEYLYWEYGVVLLPTRSATSMYEYTQTPKALEAPPDPCPAPTQTSLDPCKVRQGEMRYHRSYAHASATILRPMPKATVTSASRHCFRPLCSACMCSCRFRCLSNPIGRPGSAPLTRASPSPV